MNKFVRYISRYPVSWRLPGRKETLSKQYWGRELMVRGEKSEIKDGDFVISEKFVIFVV